MSQIELYFQDLATLFVILLAIFSYLIGSVSTARVIYYLVTKSTDYAPFKEPVPHSDEVFESDLISATWINRKLGKQYGCITSLADMLKVALPTFLVKIILTSQPWFLLVAIFGILGHNYPVYYRFVGGRGESPILGVLLVINWFGLILVNIASSILGLITGSVLVMRFGGYILMIFWYWYFFNDIYYVGFMIVANFLFWFSMRTDLTRFHELKTKKALKFSEEDVSEFIAMGKTPGRFLDKYGLYFVVKRWLQKRKREQND